MADIDIKCETCGETLTVSEYVDPDAVFCRQCGNKIHHSGTDAVSTQRLRVRDASPPESFLTESTDGVEQEGGEQVPMASVHASAEHRRKARTIHNVGSWVLFILLGAIMWYVRYGGGAGSEYLAYSQEYAWIIVVAFHVLILLKAFRDTVFHGILCVLIPPYSFYYLLMASDDFYMRALVAGLFVGFGEDALLRMNAVCMRGIDIVHRWIASGG